MPDAPRRVLPYGPNAVIVECADSAEVLAMATLARQRFGSRLVDVVPGAATVTVVGRGPLGAEVIDTLADAPLAAARPAVPTLHRIDVVYDGEDLGWVAGHLSLTVDEVIRAHTTQTWTVAFCGFAPGFGYLTGSAGGLAVPRLERPRPRVPAGSVALADRWSAVYPRSSPGGWRLIGHTDALLWDDTANPPALLAPGDQIHFRDIGR